MKSQIAKILSSRVVLIGLFLFFSLFFAKLYYDRIPTYSFGDEYNNIVAGYLMTQGRTLFSQIFFNHQLLMPVISFFLLKLFHPQTLYASIVVHREFVIASSFMWGLILLVRFREKVFLPLILFELTKFFLFGNLFLAESLIVYPLGFLLFAVLEKMQGDTKSQFDIMLGSFCVWYVFFMREPYIPLGIFLFFLLLLDKKLAKTKIISGVVLVAASVVTLLLFPLQDFWYQVVTFNLHYTLPLESKSTNIVGTGLLASFFYPFFIFFSPEKSFFKLILSLIDILFLTGGLIALYKRTYRVFFVIAFTLFLANLRVISAGKIFYEAFHMLIWYFLFLLSAWYLLLSVWREKIVQCISWIAGGIIVGIIIFAPASTVLSRIDRNREFSINYANHFLTGQVIHLLSKPDQTVFADQSDYLWYVVAQRQVAYQYGIYSFSTAKDPKFILARGKMFDNYPPDVYYTQCDKKQTGSPYLSTSQTRLYTQLSYQGNPTCLYIRSAILPTITALQWQEADKLGFSLKTQHDTL